MALTLLKRLAKGLPLTYEEMDNNLTLIENEVNSKISSTNALLDSALIGTIVDSGNGEKLQVEGNALIKGTIRSTGDVLVNTSSALGKLTVVGGIHNQGTTEDNQIIGSASTARLRLINTYSAAYGRISEIQFGVSSASNTVGACISSAYRNWHATNGTGNDLMFSTKNASAETAPLERMRITSSGNMLVGTTTDDTIGKAQIVGVTRLGSFSGTVYAPVSPFSNGVKASDTYRKIFTIPVDSASNYAHVTISGQVGAWTIASGKAHVIITINVRGGEKFSGQVIGELGGCDIKIYKEADNSYAVWASVTASTYTTPWTLAIQGTINENGTTAYATYVMHTTSETTTVPSGTLVWSLATNAGMRLTHGNNVVLGGISEIDSTYQIQSQRNVDTMSGMYIRNTSNGSNASARLVTGNLTSNTHLIHYGTGHANANHFKIYNSSPTGDIMFSPGNGDKGRFTANGNLLINTTESGTDKLQADGSLRLGATNSGLRLVPGATSSAIYAISSNTSAVFDISHQPNGNGAGCTEPAAIRLFRSTQTTGSVTFQILKGDNTYDCNHSLSGNGSSYLAGLTGNVIIGTNVSTGSEKLQVSGVIGISGASGSVRDIIGKTGSGWRWTVRLGNATAESGSNVGSDFMINSYDDAGAYLSTPFFIKRSTGNVLIGRSTEDATATARLQLINGIFLGNQANSSTNVLDYYEENTFTPTVVGLSTAGSGTYTKQIGKYTRIGNRIFFTITLGWSAHTGTGNMQINGLPITSNNTVNNAPACSIFYDGLTIGAGKQLGAYVGSNGTTITIYACDPAGGAVAGIAIDTAVTSLVLTGHYEV